MDMFFPGFFKHRIIFRIAALVWRCLLGLAPAYLQDLCYPTLGTIGYSSLRSMERGILFCPFGPWAYFNSCILSGWPLWNGLSLELLLLPRVHSDTFYSSLKTDLFSHARVGTRKRGKTRA